jgi:hypothetical protein
MDDALDARAVASRGLLDPAGVSTIADRFRRGQTGWAEPWLLMMLELWSREVLDSTGRASGRAEAITPNVVTTARGSDVAAATAGLGTP